MKKIVNLKRIGRSALSLAAYFCLTFSSGNFLPVSLALLAANLYIDFNPLSACILCFIPFLFSFSTTTILSAAWGCAILAVIFLLFSRRKKKPKFLVFYMIIALAPYAAFTQNYTLPIRIALTAIIVPLPYIFISAAKVFVIKGLKYKLSTDEIISAAFLYSLVGYGAINIFGELLWKEIGVLALLFSSAVAPYGYAIYFALISAVPLSVYSLSFTPIAIFGIYALVAAIFAKRSKLLTGLSLIGAELLLYFLTDVFSKAELYEVLLIIVPVAIFVFIPEKFFKKATDSLSVYRTASLGRYAINRDRIVLSGKLYEIASVFCEMSASMTMLGEKSFSEASVKATVTEEIRKDVCKNCKSQNLCNERFDGEDLYKIVSLGFAKGRLAVADLPKNMATNCVQPEKIVNKINYYISSLDKKLDEISSMERGRDLIKYQAVGLSEVLKGLAVSFGKQTEFNSALEKAISDNLIKCGIYALEVLVLGDGANSEIDLVVPPSAPEKSYFLKAIEEITGYKLIITYRTNLSASLSAITLKRKPNLDAAFGISQRTKDGEIYSGDTHSIIKISESKFLLALNDGMGSGKNAMTTSSVAISLIETFYKAGLPSDVILSTINKILAFDREDNFTAVDIGIVDLYCGEANFIKIGSPYSFVITKDSVKIIEGSSLPLGILDEMKPTVLKTDLSAGDMIVFLSDGISDAFGSASDMISFLSEQKALNPKTLAEDILSKAMILNGGKATDDMTAFCVRIFDEETVSKS